jgi:hypothetical protein
VGALRVGGQEGGQQEAPRAAFSRDQGAGGKENRSAEAFGGGAAPGAPAPAEAAPFAAAPVGVPANANSIAGDGTLVGSDLGAPLSSPEAEPNSGPSMGDLPGANLPADNLDQALLPRASLLNDEAALSGATNLSDFSQFMDGDGAFLELWDKDQLLFPDSLPKVDEIQFPGGLPWEREMPLPDRTPNLGGPLPLGERPVETLILAGAVGEAAKSGPALPDGQEAVAQPALAAAPGTGLARPSPDANRPAASPAGATNGPADPRDTVWVKNPLRPYKIAMGALPFLPAFGFTALTLRDRVQAGVRLWRWLRGRCPRGV